MTVADLIADAARRSYTTQVDARKVFEQLFADIAAAVRRGETMTVPGFGTFYPKRTKARRIVAPPGSLNAGEVISLPATETIGFRPARAQKRLGVLQ